MWVQRSRGSRQQLELLMDRMPKERERLLLSGRDKAAELSRSLEDPNEALHKAAESRGLTAPEVCRVVEMYNKAKSVAFLKAASSDRRAEEFPLAESSRVLDKLFNHTPKAIVKTAGEGRPVDFASAAHRPPLAKTAAEGAGRAASAQLSPATFLKRADQAQALCDASRNDARLRAGTAKQSVEKLLGKIASMLEPVNTSGRASFAQNVVNALGVEEGSALISKIASRSRFCAMSAPLAKTAHAVFMPADGPHITLGLLLDEMRKEAAAVDELNGFFTKTALVNTDVMSGLSALAPSEGSAGSAEGLDPENGMPAKLSGALKAVESKADFLKLYKFDPVLNGYPLMDALQAYNDIRRTTPSLATNKLWIRAAMRRYLTQGGMLDQFELKDMLATSGARAKERNEMNSYMDSASIKPDREVKPKRDDA